ncbi:hypothetical protein [Micromonospora chersina]|uniref:hypothetical protein n=1 Tax=Micromonospora chersina TaxID=47854 RepID=UPI003D923D66
MTTGGSSELVRRPNGSTRATLLELLFDVVFVAALALVSMLIAERASWNGLAPVFAVGYVIPHLVRGVVLVGVLHRRRHMAEAVEPPPAAGRPC